MFSRRWQTFLEADPILQSLLSIRIHSSSSRFTCVASRWLRSMFCDVILANRIHFTMKITKYIQIQQIIKVIVKVKLKLNVGCLIWSELHNVILDFKRLHLVASKHHYFWMPLICTLQHRTLWAVQEIKLKVCALINWHKLLHQTWDSSTDTC